MKNAFLSFCIVCLLLATASCSKSGNSPCGGRVGCGGGIPVVAMVDVLLRDTVSLQTAAALFDSLNHAILSVHGFNYLAVVPTDSQAYVVGTYKAKGYLLGVAEVADTGTQMTFHVALDTFGVSAQQDWFAFQAQFHLVDLHNPYKHLHIKVDSGKEAFYAKQFSQYAIVDTATETFLML